MLLSPLRNDVLPRPDAETGGTPSSSAGAGGPDVTVVVPVFNDPLVEQAIASALNQTLRSVEVVVVDHGSTDGTGRLIDGIAARNPRVRALHLPDNEGGPGRPLNLAIDAAAGRYITILGSDDELERDACRTLVEAAEVDDADVVTSLTRRIHVHEGNRVRPWYPVLYRRRRTLEGIRADLDQIWDQIPVGKLYRAGWLREREVRFPEDVVYEDQLFMMRAYVRARRISVVPVATYQWMVRSKAVRPSITHTLSDIGNVLDRIAVNERIDALLAAEAGADIKPSKDRKFIRHDLKMYLQELWKRDEPYRRTFTEVVSRYLTTVSEDVLAEEPVPLRVALWLLRRGDLDGALSAFGYVLGRGRVATELVRDGGRVYWTSRHLDSDEGRRWLDVTELGLDRVPPPAMHLYNELAIAQAHGDRLEVQGVVLNQLGVIPEAADVRVNVVVQARRGGRQVRFRGSDVVRDGSTIRFNASLDLGSRLDLRLRRTQIFDVYLETAWDGLVNVTRTTATAGGWPGVVVTVASPRRLLVGDTLVPYGTRAGNLSFQLTHSTVTAARVGDAVAGLTRSAPVRRASRTYRSMVRPRAQLAYYEACKRLPVRRSTVVFEAFEGRQYSDSPRAVYEALRRMHPELDVVWSYSARRGPSGFPKDATLVRRGSTAYYKALATAGYWVDNYGLPKSCPPRPETTYVQTWHGTPFKTLFFDTPQVRALSPQEQDAWQEYLDRWDYVVIPNDYWASTFLRSSNTRALPIRAGLPRNDVLVRGNDSATIDQLKRQLGLPTDRRIVLYAPTYRPAPVHPEFRYPDLTELAAGLGEDHFLLLRQHYYRRAMKVPPSLSWFARDVSRLDEMSQLLLVSDVLVTDYSSVSFDYAFLRRPMVFYVPDLEQYTHVAPCTYVELEQIAPGPLVRTTEEIVDAVRGTQTCPDAYAKEYEAFFQRFCAADNGRAAETVVEAVWGPGQG
jgi:CDP-glycerol glycerophosphotransferase